MPLALLDRTSSANFCKRAILFGGTRIFCRIHRLSVLISTGTVSAVRGHNIARVSKSYESFGDRFSTVVIDDLVTSDLQAAVKGK